MPAVYDHNGLKIEKYWEIDYCDKIRISEADALDALEEKLTEAVRLRMIADVPLGALLSGGVDSVGVPSDGNVRVGITKKLCSWS